MMAGLGDAKRTIQTSFFIGGKGEDGRNDISRISQQKPPEQLGIPKTSMHPLGAAQYSSLFHNTSLIQNYRGKNWLGQRLDAYRVVNW